MEYRPLYRDEDIREKAYIILEEILELHTLTNLKNSNRGELDKTENARACISAFWELFDLLGAWAQSHIMALARSYHDDTFNGHMHHEYPNVHIDSYYLEKYGYDLLWSLRTSFETEHTNFFNEEVEHMSELGRKEQILRKFLFEILSARSEFSHAWRYPFQKALRAMNDGQIEDLLRPPPIRRGGSPFSLNQWKHEALLQVYFRLGKGLKKYRAQEEVADGIAQSVDTVRDWEKYLKFDPDYSAELQCAEIAGKHLREIKSGVDVSIGFSEYGTFRGRPIIEIASELLPTLENRTFKEIAENIKRYRIRD